MDGRKFQLLLCCGGNAENGSLVFMQVDRGDMVPQESVLFHGFLMKRSLGRSTTAIHNWRNRYLVLSGPYTHGDSAHYCNEIRW